MSASKKMGRPPKITDAIILAVAIRLAQRETKGEVKTFLKSQHKLSARSCESVITKSRQMLLSSSDKSAEEHKRDAYAFYDSVVRDALCSSRDRLKAQERIDRLFGLDAPLKLHHGGENGGPMSIDLKLLTTEELEALDAIAQRVARPREVEGGTGGAEA